MVIETRRLSELKPHPLNPRSITVDKFNELKRKIARWGQLGAILVDGRDKSTILGGNHAYEAMKALNYETAKVEYRTPKDDAEALELLIVHNERYAQWVEQDLAELLQKYKDQIDLSGYSIDLGRMTDLKKVLARFGQTEEDEAPGLESDPESKLGEVYQLGRHRVMCGDSTKIEDVKKLMNGKKADLLLTDPPYGISYEGNQTGTKWDMIKNDDLRGGALQKFLYMAFQNMAECAIPAMPAYIFYASITHREFQAAFELAGYTMRQQLIWVKHMVIGNSDYHWTHEPIFYVQLGKERPPFYGDRSNKTVLDTVGYNQLKTLQKETLLNLLMAIKSRSTVQNVEKDTQNYAHPTQKPVAIMTPLIKNSTSQEGLVVDLFAGSGTTLIAAHQLDRICYAMEFDPQYCDVIRKRYAKFIKEEHRWQEVTKKI